MRERCLRTVLISPMAAPERSSARVTACLSANETPSAGAIQLAEAPPDISTSTRSFSAAAFAESSVAQRCGQAGGSREPDGRPRSWSPLATAGRSRGAPPPRRRSGRRQLESVEIVPFRHIGHGTRGFAGGEHDELASRRRRQAAAAGTTPDGWRRPRRGKAPPGRRAAMVHGGDSAGFFGLWQEMSRDAYV